VRGVGRRPRTFGTSEPLTRFLLLAGLVAVVALPTGLTFWYWRLTRLGPAEARMALLDTGWSEARRELNRQEKWRTWGLTRRRPRPAKKPPPRPEERPEPTGPRRSFAEALALTCGMVCAGGFVAFIAVMFLVRYFAR
jgi:hypothetical protein